MLRAFHFGAASVAWVGGSVREGGGFDDEGLIFIFMAVLCIRGTANTFWHRLQVRNQSTVLGWHGRERREETGVVRTE